MTGALKRRVIINMWLVVLLFVLGIILIVKGGDYFVDASVWIADALNVPKFLVGATIVSIATTMPEMLVSIFAAIDKMPDMSVGNAVGSVTANIGLIMSISIIAMPAAVKRGEITVKGFLMLFSALMLILFAKDGYLSVAEASIILAVFVIYMTDTVISAKKLMGTSSNGVNTSKKEIAVNIFKFIIGITAIVLGAQLLVDNGSEIARRFKVPEGIIAVTLIAIGTSLPELVTTISAVVKKQSSLSVGNIIGANIIDITLIMPLCSLIYRGKIPISQQTVSLDLPVCIGVIMLAVIPTVITGKFKRWQGIVMGALYAAYIVVMCITLR